MNKLKKLLALVLVVCMVCAMSTTAWASETQASSDSNTMQTLPYDEKLDQLEWHDYGSLDTLSIEDTYAYDEFITYLKDNGFTDSEAVAFSGKRPIETRGTSIRYSLMRMDTFSYSGGYKLQPRFRVGLEYNTGSSSPNRIATIGNPTMYTGGGSKCVFSGEVFYELMSGNSFYYDFNGDVYREGSIQWSIGAQVGIGKMASADASISNGNGYVTNVSDAGEYYSEGLDS